MLKPPKLGARCVIKEMHPDNAGLVGTVEQTYQDGLAELDVEPCTKYPLGATFLIDIKWLEEESHAHA